MKKGSILVIIMLLSPSPLPSYPFDNNHNVCLSSIVYNQITGGGFAKNMADYGGFLYKEGEGETSCTGASILQHQGVDGGAIHAVDGAVLDWACDIGNNSALAGPAM